ncbi:MAG: exodeoxyribonuclease VII large subunit [Syntrophomonadaceae bacterium]
MRDYITVSMLNAYVSRLLDQDELLQEFWLKGELSGYRFYKQSGHSYFSLKDKDSAVSCVMFKSRNQAVNFQPEDGMEVLLRGYVSVYARQGKYQVYVEEMLPYGTGSLFIYLEKLKAQLAGQGYFEATRKRLIPPIVNRIGVVTSQDGAALQDILRVIRQRHPGAQVILAHSSVQGSEAPKELAAGIRMLNEYGLVEVIIIARGGGSVEDLMAFNSEEVVQAVYASDIPVISGVGHEVDVTFCDLAADLRAATPTQAAQFAVPDYTSIKKHRDELGLRMARSMQRLLAARLESLDRCLMKKVWSQPQLLAKRQADLLLACQQRLGAAMLENLKTDHHRFTLTVQGLESRSPLNVLTRGYAIVAREGVVVKRIDEVSEGDRLQVEMIDGRLTVVIQGKEKIARWKN